MLKILPFKSGRAPKTKDFGLEDLSDDTFDISRADVALFRKVPYGDWSNQELASIYLAVRLLKGAGVAVETDRGVADDGNPWFVFCNANGDVVVHIARIDLAYILDGVGLDNPLTGKTFDELINRFVSGATDKATSEKKEGLSAALDLSKHRQNKVFVHPAAQLVALIWAAMMVKDAAEANAAEVDWATFDEPSTQHTNAVIFGIPDSSHIVRQRPSEPIEYHSSDAFVRSRDLLTSGLQSAGLLSLGFFLIAPEDMSLGAMLDWFRMEAEIPLEEEAVAVSPSSAPDGFIDVLEILAALNPAIEDDMFDASQAHAANADYIFDVEHTYALAHLVGPPEKMFEMGLSVGHQIEVVVPRVFSEVPQVHAEAPQEVVEAPASPAATDELEEPYTISDLLNYLAEVELNPLQGNETFVEELTIIVQEGEVPRPDTLIETDAAIDDAYVIAPVIDDADVIAAVIDDADVIAPVIDDADVIAAVIEFLNAAEEVLTFYFEEGVHIIEYQAAGSENLSDTLSLSWTFADGSQILIVGAASDLLPLDLLF